MQNGSQQKDDPRVGRLLLAVLTLWAGVSGVVLALAAPGPLEAKIGVTALLVLAVACTVAWHHGYRRGVRARETTHERVRLE